MHPAFGAQFRLISKPRLAFPVALSLSLVPIADQVAIWFQRISVYLAKKLHHAARNVVHCAGNLDGSLLFQILQHGASSPDVLDGKAYISARYGVHINRILA